VDNATHRNPWSVTLPVGAPNGGGRGSGAPTESGRVVAGSELVGRGDVLAQLAGAVEDAAVGRGGVVLLTGEAGIGKTAVAAETAAAQARGARVAWGWGWQGEGTPALWPWMQVLRSLAAQDGRLRRLAAATPSTARLLPELAGPAGPSAAGDEPAGAARFRLLDELASVLLAAAEERPLLVVLEDLQWADPGSLQLLDFLARRLPASRTLILGTWRDLDQLPDDPLAPQLAGLASRSAVGPSAAALGDEDTPPRARVLASLARELAWNGADLARATRLATEAMASARRTGDRATLAVCLLAQHNAGWGPGNAAERLDLAGQAAELAGDDAELLAEARLLRAADLLELADPGFGAELEEFLRIASDLEQPRLRCAALTRRATQALLAARLGEAERLIAEAATLARSIGEPDAADVEQAQLWELRALQGRRAELGQRLSALLPADSPQAIVSRALILLEQGDHAGAEATAAPLLDATAPPDFPADRNWTVGASFASELAAALGMRPACQRLYDALLPHAGGAAVVGAAIAFRGAVAHHLGLLAAALGRPTAARAHFEQAMAVHERLGARAWTLRSRYELARALPVPEEAATLPRWPRRPAGWAWPSWPAWPVRARSGRRRRPTGSPATSSGATGRCGRSPTPAVRSGCGTPRASATWPCSWAAPAGRSTPPSWSPGRPATRPRPPGCGSGPTRCSTTGPAPRSAPASSTWRPRWRRPAAGTTRSGPPGPPWSGTRWWPSWPPPPAWAAAPGASVTSPSAPARPSPPGSATSSTGSSASTRPSAPTCGRR
jgi:AAA ATPase domain